MNNNSNENYTDELPLKVRLGGKRAKNLNVKSLSLRPNRSVGKLKSLRPQKPRTEAVLGRDKSVVEEKES